MVSLLLIISFLLHIILLIAIYFLYQQLEQVKHSKNKQIETVLENFLHEVKEENERLQQQLQEQNHTQEERMNRDEAPSVYENKLDQMVNHVQNRENIKQKVAPEPPVDQKVDKLETSLEAQVFQMAKAGMSADQIAQKLDRGKTEIELMLKLQLKQ